MEQELRRKLELPQCFRLSRDYTELFRGQHRTESGNGGRTKHVEGFATKLQIGFPEEAELL